jgi:hypothetical protein
MHSRFEMAAQVALGCNYAGDWEQSTVAFNERLVVAQITKALRLTVGCAVKRLLESPGQSGIGVVDVGYPAVA